MGGGGVHTSHINCDFLEGVWTPVPTSGSTMKHKGKRVLTSINGLKAYLLICKVLLALTVTKSFANEPYLLSMLNAHFDYLMEGDFQ